MKNKNIEFLNLWSVSPFSWAIIRAVELLLLKSQKYKRPILEIGCGDGLVSSILFNHRIQSIDLGIDLDSEELRRAAKTRIYKKLVCLDILKNNFKKGTFNTVFANGVLEHIPNLDATLNEISRILKPGGRLITTSPTSNYKRLLLYYRFLSALGFNHLADQYGNTINTIFAHHHLYTHEIWEKKLRKAGLTLVSYQYYNSATIIGLHDLMLPFSALTKFTKKHFDSMAFFPLLRKTVFKSLAGSFDFTSSASLSKEQAGSVLLIAEKK